MKKRFIILTSFFVVVSCTSRNRHSSTKLSPFSVKEVSQNKYQTIFIGESIDLTTYIAGESELIDLFKTMRPEVYEHAKYHGEMAGKSYRMSQDELGMFFAYSSNEWYKEWNTYLRTEPLKRNKDLAKEAEIKVLATALNKHKGDDAHSGMVYRGAGLHDRYYEPIKAACRNGDLSITRAFFSTSLSEEVAKSYSKLNDDERKSGQYQSVVYYVMVSEEPSLGFLSQSEQEKEVLVLPNNVFQLVGIQEATASDPYTKIYMIEVDTQTGMPMYDRVFDMPDDVIVCNHYDQRAGLVGF